MQVSPHALPFRHVLQHAASSISPVDCGSSIDTGGSRSASKAGIVSADAGADSKRIANKISALFIFRRLAPHNLEPPRFAIRLGMIHCTTYRKPRLHQGDAYTVSQDLSFCTLPVGVGESYP
jgi:hypothetical protein